MKSLLKTWLCRLNKPVFSRKGTKKGIFFSTQITRVTLKKGKWINVRETAVLCIPFQGGEGKPNNTFIKLLKDGLSLTGVLFLLAYSQTRSSVPVANKLMNSLMEK